MSQEHVIKFWVAFHSSFVDSYSVLRFPEQLTFSKNAFDGHFYELGQGLQAPLDIHHFDIFYFKICLYVFCSKYFFTDKFVFLQYNFYMRRNFAHTNVILTKQFS